MDDATSAIKNINTNIEKFLKRMVAQDEKLDALHYDINSFKQELAEFKTVSNERFSKLEHNMKEVEDSQVLINNKFEINKGKTDDLFRNSNQVHKDLLQLKSQIKPWRISSQRKLMIEWT